jgi:hypothetical protein
LPTCSSPVRHVSAPKRTPSDLHALGTPPALILSQDQTLHQDFGVHSRTASRRLRREWQISKLLTAVRRYRRPQLHHPIPRFPRHRAVEIAKRRASSRSHAPSSTAPTNNAHSRPVGRPVSLSTCFLLLPIWAKRMPSFKGPANDNDLASLCQGNLAVFVKVDVKPDSGALATFALALILPCQCLEVSCSATGRMNSQGCSRRSLHRLW